MKKFLKNEGFTLVELIVVIAILGILAAVAVPAYSGYIQKANKSADITTLDAVKTAAIAACAQDGAVTALTVTDGPATGTGAYTVTGTVNGTEGVNIAADKADFKMFYTGDITLKTGETASWTGGEWSITGTVD